MTTRMSPMMNLTVNLGAAQSGAHRTLQASCSRRGLQPQRTAAPGMLRGQRAAPGSGIAGRSSALAASTPQAAAAAAAAAVPQRLADLDMYPVISVQGFIQPVIPEGTEATVFAIYDQAKILQYVGFSKDLRQSLRTVFGRRPDRAHYFRALHLPRLDQQAMVDIRTAWFAENAGPPAGNKLPMERSAWQEPAQSFSISERGKAAAAEELVKQVLAKIRARGCKEDFFPDPELLAQGQVDFLAAAALTPEDLQRQRDVAAAMARATRRCSTTLDGEATPFDMIFTRSIPTNGGMMFDLRVTFQDKESLHRVIVGKVYYETQGVEAEMVAERVFAFLLRKKVPRQTEGMLVSSQFPINYFSVSEVHQFFADFEEEFEEGQLPGDGGFWRFNRTQDYGYKGGNENQKQLSAQFARGWKARESTD